MICKYVIALIWLQFHYEVLDLMISKYVETLILSIIQGISEFIPVSSSAHLLIISRLSDFNVSNLQLDISLHLGSLLAIILFFRKELIIGLILGVLRNLTWLRSYPLNLNH